MLQTAEFDKGTLEMFLNWYCWPGDEYDRTSDGVQITKNNYNSFTF